MRNIYLLTDYKGYFGSKWKARPYRGGYDLGALARAFAFHGYECEFMACSEVFASNVNWKGRIVLYTSSEEVGNNYKLYVEDVVLGLEEAGATVLPRGVFLRSHNNKVMMELLREQLLGEELTGLRSRTFGTLQELRRALGSKEIPFPCVLKSAYGSMSKGVSCAGSAEELLSKARRVSRTPHLLYEVRDAVRRHRPLLRGYEPESRHQGAFVVQPLIAGLDCDWKVLVYGDHYYVLKRHTRPGDFRASGSHFNYRAGRDAGIPDRALEMVKTAYEKLDVPHLSADVAFDGDRAYLVEFQCVYFGTSTQAEFCSEYIQKADGQWNYFPKVMSQEEAYAYGVDYYLSQHRQLQDSQTE